MEGSVVGLMTGGFVAREDGETGLPAEVRVGGDHFGKVVVVFNLAGGQGGDGLVPHLVFERPDAALTPAGEGHAIDAGAFGCGAGLEGGEVVLKEGVEVVAGFVLEEDDVDLPAAAAVSKGVAGRAALSRVGPGARGKGRVGSRTDDSAK